MKKPIVLSLSIETKRQRHENNYIVAADHQRARPAEKDFSVHDRFKRFSQKQGLEVRVKLISFFTLQHRS
jgi:hypothetical protein